MTFEQLEMLAEEELAKLLDDLPGELKEPLGDVAFVFEPRPSDEDCDLGIAEDFLGLFVGPSFAHPDAPYVPRIVCWLENLWDFSDEEEAEFRRQVRITLLHEIGHYLDLDEDDLAWRGLG